MKGSSCYTYALSIANIYEVMLFTKKRISKYLESRQIPEGSPTVLEQIFEVKREGICEEE